MTNKAVAAIAHRHPIQLDLMPWKGSPDGDAFEIRRIRLLEFDDQARARTKTLFDCDDRAAAFAAAETLFLEGERAARR